MPFCANCGTQYDEGVKFCPGCGAATAAPEQPQQQAYQAPQQEAYQQPNYQQPNYQQPVYAAAPANKTMAMLAVIFPILFFLPLVAGEKTEFDTFWANQALLLLIMGVVASITAAIIIGVVIGIFQFVVWIMAIIAVCKGEMKPLPLVGKITIIK